MSGSAEFVHLHTHSSFSVLDGVQKPVDMCQRAAEMDQPALANTDHGSLAGSWKFAAAAKAAGIKAILGEEIYLSIGSRFERNQVQVGAGEKLADADEDERGKSSDTTGRKKTKRYEHLTVLARNAVGWQNLVRITNASWEADAYWYKPRADLGLLAEHGDGLIVLTGCLGGPVAGQVLAGDMEQARTNLHRLIDAVGRENVFVEVMDHGIPAERKVIPGLMQLAKEAGLPLVATNDAHYLLDSHADAHDCWLAVGVNRKLTDPGRFRFNGSGYHLRTAEQMREEFSRYGRAGLDAVRNSLMVAEMCDDEVLPASRLRLPRYRDADGGEVDSPAYLYKLVREGAVRRYGSPLPAAVKERCRFELDVINGAGLSDYFLGVWDMINWARSNGIRVGPGRGSAAGSAVSYCLGIVNVDPIANNLLFERFLNPERAGMPDIDTDFDSEGRDRVVRYLSERWGRDYVARIGTFGMTLSKKAVRDVARVTEQHDIGDKMARLIPSTGGGKPYPFAALLDEEDKATEAYRDLLDAEPQAARLHEIASAFEGIVGSEGIHACGVLISDEPLDGLVPLRHERKKGVDTGVFVTQWDGKDVDAFGLLKLDALALRNLDTISECVRIIKETTGEDVDADNPPMDPDDPRVRKVWEMLAAGRTAGVFQMGSAGMTRLCTQIQPESLSDVAAIVALYRPGPLAQKMHEHYAARKAGDEQVDYGLFTHEPREQQAIASVLDETYGAIVYQEQLMRLSEVVAGFDAGQRNALQKAFSKKLRDKMAELEEMFVQGAQREIRDEHGNPVKIAFKASTAANLWKTFSASADYLFNASHAFAYGFVSYMTAYLKANWPSQYGAAVLATTKKQSERQAAIDSMRREGIDIRQPDVNLGAAATSAGADGAVRLGMAEVRDVGSNAEWIVRERERGGPFTSLHDLLHRVKVPGQAGNPEPDKNLPLNVVEALVGCGAADVFGPRMGMVTWLRALREAEAPAAVPDAEWGAIERSARERELLGVSVSEGPLADAQIKADIKTWRDPYQHTRPRPIHQLGEGRAVTVGVVARWAEKAYKGGRMATMTLEGTSGSLECVIWNDDLAAIKTDGLTPAVGDVIGVNGQVKLVVPRRVKDGSSDDFDDLGDDADGDEAEADPRREMTVRQIWKRPLAGGEPRVALPSNVVPFRQRALPKAEPAPQPVAREPRSDDGDDDGGDGDDDRDVHEHDFDGAGDEAAGYRDDDEGDDLYGDDLYGGHDPRYDEDRADEIAWEADQSADAVATPAAAAVRETPPAPTVLQSGGVRGLSGRPSDPDESRPAKGREETTWPVPVWSPVTGGLRSAVTTRGVYSKIRKDWQRTSRRPKPAGASAKERVSRVAITRSGEELARLEDALSVCERQWRRANIGDRIPVVNPNIGAHGLIVGFLEVVAEEQADGGTPTPGSETAA